MTSLSLGLGLPFIRSATATPLALFANGEDGGWWDSQDLSTLFSDAARTTPAVVDGEVLGQTDKSGNGNHRTQTTPGNGPILRQRADGVYYLDCAGGKTLSVPSSTALFNYLHNGTGGTLLAFIEWPQTGSNATYLQTATATSQAGIQINRSGTSQNGSFLICRASSGVFAANVDTSALGKINPSGVPRMIRMSYKNDGASTDQIVGLDSGRNRATMQTANAPSSANAGANLQINANFAGREYGVIALSRVATDDEVALVYNYFRQQDYRVPSVDLTLLCGGQSNMSGRGLLTPTSVAAQEGVYTYDRAEEFRLAYEPSHAILNQPIATSPNETNIATPAHSAMLPCGKALKDDASQDVLIVPCAVGGTSMAQWDTPLTVEDRTTLIGAMAYRYKIAKAKGGTPVILWYGHEANAGLAVADFTNGGVGTAYQTAWASLIATVRGLDPDLTDAPLIYCQLASDDTLATAVAHAAAGEAQRQTELTVPNSYMVVTHDLARNASTDDIHVSRAGQEELGQERIALAIREHVLLEAVNGTGPRIVSASYSGSTVTLTCDKALNTTAGDYGDLFRVYADGVEQTVSSANRGTDTSTVEIVCSAPLSGSVTLTYGYRAGPASAARTDFVADADGLPLPLFGPLTVTA